MNFRPFILPIMLSALLLGCSASSRLQSAFGNKYRYSISMVTPERSTSMLFRDDVLIIQFRLDDPAVRFQLQNLSPAHMSIEWPQASIGIRGTYSPVRNLATFYDSGAAARVSPLIPSLGVVRDVVLPRGNASFDGMRWRVADLLPTADENSDAKRRSILEAQGSNIDVVLPILVGTDRRIYRFTFVVDSVRQISWTDQRIPDWLPPQPPVRKLTPSTVEQITAAIIAGSFLGVFAYMRTAKKSPIVE
ncbi:MAG: hypothetical protein FJ217_07530 [Ignavibacteria bacterium]|nr:hypothetical protein [Ignavibacteria bacterium]